MHSGLVCSDTKPSYKAFVDKNHFVLKTINVSTKEQTNGIYHVQNVNAYDSRLKEWMKHVHGGGCDKVFRQLSWLDETLLKREKISLLNNF